MYTFDGNFWCGLKEFRHVAFHLQSFQDKISKWTITSNHLTAAFPGPGRSDWSKTKKNSPAKVMKTSTIFCWVFFVCVSNTFSLRFWHFCWKLCPHAFHFNVTAGFPSLKPVHWAHLSCTLRMACATIKQLFDHWAVNLARAKDALAWNNLLLASYPWSWQFTKECSLLECCKLFNSLKFCKKVKLFCTLKTCIIKFRI